MPLSFHFRFTFHFCQFLLFALRFHSSLNTSSGFHWLAFFIVTSDLRYFHISACSLAFAIFSSSSAAYRFQSFLFAFISFWFLHTPFHVFFTFLRFHIFETLLHWLSTLSFLLFFRHFSSFHYFISSFSSLSFHTSFSLHFHAFSAFDWATYWLPDIFQLFNTEIFISSSYLPEIRPSFSEASSQAGFFVYTENSHFFSSLRGFERLSVLLLFASLLIVFFIVITWNSSLRLLRAGFQRVIFLFMPIAAIIDGFRQLSFRCHWYFHAEFHYHYFIVSFLFPDYSFIFWQASLFSSFSLHFLEASLSAFSVIYFSVFSFSSRASSLLWDLFCPLTFSFLHFLFRLLSENISSYIEIPLSSSFPSFHWLLFSLH